ncbi:MAG TPA: insulinase family protein, partial [Humisphaera sp.]
AKPAGGPAAAAPSQPGAASVEVTDVKVNKTEQALAGIVIGFRADTVVGEPDTFPLAVADTMASGYTYPAGWLFEELRGRGLVYVVHAQNSPGRSKDLPGAFIVYAGCEPSKVNDVVDLILENIARLQGTPADWNEKWYGRSKELIVVSDAMATQTATEQATQAALDELYGLGHAWHRQFAQGIRSVAPEQVREVSRNRLARCVVTVSTPEPAAVSAKPGVRRYEKFPPVELTPRGTQHDAGGGGSGGGSGR